MPGNKINQINKSFKLLEKIKETKDIKKLNLNELKELSKEIRNRIITSVSRTGGHLAPSLGTVELTIALHKVFNSPKDKIIWDVGHQAYSHKLLTGRNNLFHTLRQYKGISGFLKPSESIHDVFGAGHASTSISAAIGIAEARDLKKEEFDVIAVIGDGSLSGGMAFEALNNIGYLQTNITVIINDNKMSISPNVGSLSKHLKRISNIASKEKPRRALGTIFGCLGFKYIGPVNGHDLEELIFTLERIKKIKGPKAIHVITKKGKGYKPAEKTPTKFHGISQFDFITGKSNNIKKTITYTKVFANTLTNLAKKDKKIIAITAAMPSGTGLDKFMKEFPERFYDVGIAEEHAVTFAAGLATNGMKPAVTIYSTFLQRSFDQIIHDVALQKLPVKFFLDRAGLVGDDGPTHHGCFDLSYLRIIPNTVVMAPKDENELQDMIKTAMNYNSNAIAVRYPRGPGLGVKLEKPKEIEIGKAELIKKGNDITLIGIGNMVENIIQASNALKEEGINAEVINARFVKPLDEKLILKSIEKTKKVITIEENILAGGFGSAIIELLKDNDLNAEIKRIGIPDEFIEQGSQKILRDNLRLNAANIFIEGKYMVKCKKHNIKCKRTCEIARAKEKIICF